MDLFLPENLLPSAMRFLDLLDHWNRVHALTALKPEDRFEELVLDSAALLPFMAPIPAGARVVDFGTGMGVPAFLLALARPDVQVLGVDRSQKKLAFLRQVALELNLTNLHPTLGDAEVLPPLGAALGTAKAVGSLDYLMALWARHGLDGAPFLAMKGQGWERESRPTKGWNLRTHSYCLPTRGDRVLVECVQSTGPEGPAGQDDPRR